MLSRYSHVPMEAKRRALDEIAARLKAADEKRREDAERREQDLVAAQPTMVHYSSGPSDVRYNHGVCRSPFSTSKAAPMLADSLI
ncbi:MAG: hypothetical protein M1541_03090 [Acidobacteria bacterium]|nr:hypothetical protein [Acidobacteriota bacterium]